MNWLLFWLFLHITIAVLAFGPTFAFPFIGALAQKNPQHAPFAFRLSEMLEERLILPLAGTMLITGTGALIAAHINLLKTPFLVVGIVLYLIAMGIASGLLRPTARKLVQMTEHAPPLAAGASPGAPPPEVLALIRRSRIFGTTLQLLFLIIIFLMIVKPGGITNGPLFG